MINKKSRPIDGEAEAEAEFGMVALPACTSCGLLQYQLTSCEFDYNNIIVLLLPHSNLSEKVTKENVWIRLIVTPPITVRTKAADVDGEQGS